MSELDDALESRKRATDLQGAITALQGSPAQQLEAPSAKPEGERVPNPFTGPQFSNSGLLGTPSAVGNAAAPDEDLLALARGENPEDNKRTWLNAAKEVVQSPVQGGIEAVDQASRTLGYGLNWGLKHTIMPEPYQKTDENGLPVTDEQGKPAMTRGDFWDWANPDPESWDKLPNVSEPVSLGGRMASGVAQFMTGFKGVNAVWNSTSLLGSKTGAILAKGAMADITAFDGHTANLADLARNIPALDGPLTQYLSANPDDSQAEGKLKLALTGAIGGAVAEKFVFPAIKYTATYTRDWKNAQAAVEANQRASQSDVAKLSEMSAKEKSIAMLGDPNQTAWRYYDKDTIAAEQAAADKERTQIKPAPGYAYSEEHAAEGTEPPQIVKEPTVPPELGRANTSFNQSGQRYSVDFQTPEDRLAYIATSTGKHAETALDTLKSAGWTEEQVGRIGAAIREDVGKSAIANGPTVSKLTAPIAARNLFVDEATQKIGGVPLEISAQAMHKVAYGEGQSYGLFNFAAMQTPEGILSAVRQMQDSFDKAPELRTWAQAQQEAHGINAFDEMFNAPRDLPNDSRTIATRELIQASIAKTYKLAQDVTTAAAQGTLDNTMRFAFGQMLETHRMVSNFWNWQGTELARSFNARKFLPDGTNINARLRQMDAALGTIDGVNNLEYVAQKVIDATESGNQAKLANIDPMIRGWAEKSTAALHQMWVNGILSSTKSLIMNAVNPIVMTASQAVERGMMEGWAKLTGDASGVAPGEMVQWLSGMASAIPEGARFAKQAYQFGGRGRAWGDMYARTSIDQNMMPNRANPLSEEYWATKESSPATQALASAMDVLGTLTNWAPRANLAGDEFWSTLFYRGEVRSRAFRQATQELNSGAIDEAGFSQRFEALIDDPTKGIQDGAKDWAERNTLTNDPGKVGKMLESIRNLGTKTTGPLGWMVMPFTTIPANVLNYAMERTPLNALTKNFLQTIAAGGEEGQRMLAKTMTGSMALAVGMDAYQRGYLVGRGSTDPKEAQALSREGVRPYSIRIGDVWMPYNRWDNLGYLFSMVGDLGDFSSYLNGQDEYHTAGLALNTTMTVMAMINSALGKSYMQGMQQLSQAIQQPQLYGKQFVYNQLSTFIPNSGLMGNVHQAIDDNLRQANSELQAWISKIPGLGEGLPPKYDLFARPMTVSRGTSQIWNAFMPFEMSKHNPEPIDAELVKNKMFFSMPGKKLVMGDKEIDMQNNLDAYARYVQLAGNELRDPVYGMGCKDLLNSIVEGNHPLSPLYGALKSVGGNDSEKAAFVKQIINQYRDMAKPQIIQEFPGACAYPK